ncbi:hypothetical protein [Microbulbifer sp. 2205BS26-8]|uniref:hypothetical protein n=1 Tax=Microbulbifer sp. 2205BS26-8 TaxID=3064386 RepID=UPI00273E8A6A|nr:hypothetical protein [Microbulbifer sp. 2205BS26-8]MDP5211292.1 hypothetical protein [Microbulbifer sp. 2205BS26-8]
MVEEQKFDFLQMVPKVHRVTKLASDQLTIWDISKESLKERAFSIPKHGPFILVVSTPLCSFCNSAAKYISSDEELKIIFSEYSYWLTEPRGQLYTEHFERWSLRYPKLPAGLMNVKPPSPVLRSNIGTPAFYFFLDGDFVQSFVGWPREGEPIALDSALANIGLNRFRKPISKT